MRQGKQKRFMVRQGDVLLFELGSEFAPLAHYSETKIPAGAKEVPRGDDPRGIILAVGESSGHAHGIASRQAHEYMHGEDRYVAISGKAGVFLLHEMPDRSPTGDHGPVKLKPRELRFVEQREFSDDMIVPVAD